MNLRDLQYLIAVAETQHFGRAAERCYVSQPTLSGQIKKLEQELGIVLFERSNRSVQITPAGEAILLHARLMVEQADAIRQLAGSFKDPLAGPLRIGVIPTISPYLMPLILRPLQQQYSQLRLIISEEQTEVLLRRLHDHEIDAAILATDHSQSDLLVKPLYQEPFWLAYPHNHPLYNKDEITLEDIEESGLLLLSEGHCLADQALEMCHVSERNSQGDMANLRASSLETLLQLVSAGYGTTLVPALALSGSRITGSGVVTRQLEIEHASRRVVLYYRSSFPRSKVIELLGKQIQAHLPNTVEAIN